MRRETRKTMIKGARERDNETLGERATRRETHERATRRHMERKRYRERH